jgi:hypothetical protein
MSASNASFSLLDSLASMTAPSASVTSTGSDSLFGSSGAQQAKTQGAAYGSYYDGSHPHTKPKRM